MSDIETILKGMEFIRKNLALIAAIVIIAASVTLAVAIVGTAPIIHDLLHPQYSWLVLLVGAQVIAYAGYAMAYRSLFNLRFENAARNTLYGFSPLVALGGFTYDAKTAESKYKVIALGVVEYLVLTPATWVAAMVGLIWHLAVPKGFLLPWAIAFPIGLAAALAVIKWRLRIGTKVSLFLDAFYKDCLSLGLKRWLIVIAGIAVYWAGEMLALYGALRMFDARLGAAALIIAFASGYVLTQRSSPASFSGLIIILLVIMLHLVGVHYGAAFLATYSYLVVSILLPLGYLAAMHQRE